MKRRKVGAALLCMLLTAAILLPFLSGGESVKAALEENVSAIRGIRQAGRVQAEEIDVPEDGVYTIDGVLRHAYANQNSMGNGAMVKPMEIWVEEGEAILRMEFVPLTSQLGSAGFTGYLAYFYYFPDWEGGSSGTEAPVDETPVAADVESYYEDVYDEYNDPDTGLDENVKGELYPHYMTMPVDLYDAEIWTQVYVPVMETIVAGNGLQYARLQLDWGTFTRKGDLPDEEKPGEDDTGTEKPGDTEKAVDKGTLHTLLISAASLAGRESIYTKDSLTRLKNAIERAENVYADEDATQTQVDTQVKTLSKAILNLEQKETDAGSGGSGSGNGNTASGDVSDGNSAAASGSTDAAEKLDFQNLADGTYSVEGKMYKTDKETLSMSNDAINHTIKLTVSGGAYSLTLDFEGLEISGQFGYLGELKYYETGYGTDSYGAPTGKTKAVTIDSWQKEDGKKVSDDFGSDYPDQVTFPLIGEAKKDGWVPLQVFVPIMDSISKGSGTQNVWLKLDIATVASADKNSFKEEESSGSKSSGKKKNTSAEKSSSSSAKGASSIKSGSTLPSSGSTKSSSLPTGSSLTGGSASGSSVEGNVLQNSLVTGGAADSQTATGFEAAGGTESFGDVTETEEEKSAAAVVPPFMSLLAVLAGGLYKIRSRQLF